MKDFISEYVTSLSSKRQVRVFDILSGARIAKENLDSLASKLANIKKDAPVIIAPESFNGHIQANKFDATYRDVYRRTLELFQASNEISLLLDTHSSTLISEIKAIEDELLAMEKAVDNYAFTLSDNGFYDYAFTETFNDDTMVENNANFILTDRSGVDFKLDEKAEVNGINGVLTLNPALKSSYPLVGMVVNSNCLSLATSDTGIDNSLNSSAVNGWRVALASPKPINSSLTGITVNGAQVELELSLVSAAPCDSILLTPFSDIAVDILRIQVINGAEDSNTTTILDTATTLDRPKTFGFPLQSVARFRIVINQSIYNRGELPPVKEQVVYRDFYTTVKKERENVARYIGKDYNKNTKALKRIFIQSHKKMDKDFTVFRAEIPQINFEPTRGPLTIDKLVRQSNDYNNENSLWGYKSKVNTFMKRMIDDSIFATNTEILNDRQVYNTGTAFSGNGTFRSLNSASQSYPRIVGIEPPLNADILSAATVGEKQYLNYQYNLGLRNIQIGNGTQLFRGVFISKQIPAPSGTGEIKLKSDETNYLLTNTSRDSQNITSIEYSVSNKSTPVEESDWIPVMPIDQEIVEGERLFINEAGSAILRFNANPDGEFHIYRNGYIVNLNSVSLVRNNDSNAITSIRLPLGTFSSNDIFTTKYIPFGNQSIINFESKGFSQISLASSYDDQGAGETFATTYNNQIVSLAYDPYVNYTRINTESSYSTTLGFTGTYQPITVVLSNGEIALNQTNYLGNIQNNLSSFDETTTAFIHSGKNIIFNKPIDSRFTVYYQYIPSNLRVRIIMRVNDTNYVSPVLNSIQIKAKTLKANPRKAI